MAAISFSFATATSDLATKTRAWLGLAATDIFVAPTSYGLEVHAKTREKYTVVLRAVYTLGPSWIDDGEEPLLLHAKLVSPPPDHVTKLIQCHVGALATGMTMEQVLFMGSSRFMAEVLDRVQPDLREHGLHVYRALVERMAIYPPQQNEVVVVTEEPLMELLKVAWERVDAAYRRLERERGGAMDDYAAELQGLLDLAKKMDNNCSSKENQALEESLHDLVALIHHDAGRRSPSLLTKVLGLVRCLFV